VVQIAHYDATLAPVPSEAVIDPFNQQYTAEEALKQPFPQGVLSSGFVQPIVAPEQPVAMTTPMTTMPVSNVSRVQSLVLSQPFVPAPDPVVPVIQPYVPPVVQQPPLVSTPATELIVSPLTTYTNQQVPTQTTMYPAAAYSSTTTQIPVVAAYDRTSGVFTAAQIQAYNTTANTQYPATTTTTYDSSYQQPIVATTTAVTPYQQTTTTAPTVYPSQYDTTTSYQQTQQEYTQYQATTQTYQAATQYQQPTSAYTYEQTATTYSQPQQPQQQQYSATITSNQSYQQPYAQTTDPYQQPQAAPYVQAVDTLSSNQQAYPYVQQQDTQQQQMYAQQSYAPSTTESYQQSYYGQQNYVAPVSTTAAAVTPSYQTDTNTYYPSATATTSYTQAQYSQEASQYQHSNTTTYESSYASSSMNQQTPQGYSTYSDVSSSAGKRVKLEQLRPIVTIPYETANYGQQQQQYDSSSGYAYQNSQYNVPYNGGLQQQATVAEATQSTVITEGLTKNTACSMT